MVFAYIVHKNHRMVPELSRNPCLGTLLSTSVSDDLILSRLAGAKAVVSSESSEVICFARTCGLATKGCWSIISSNTFLIVGFHFL